jgi:ferredoxin
MTAPTVRVSIMGKWYDLPAGLTILTAYEYVGYRMVRGVGCRGGLCGACATIYRTTGDFHRHGCLSCQTAVASGMILSRPQFFPANRPDYELKDLEDSKDPAGAVIEVYPELQNCIGCNACTKICPQGIDVMGYVASMLRGDMERTADLSFDCVSCGLCPVVCPAEISQFTAALLSRRLYGKHVVPRSSKVSKRAAEIRGGKFSAELLRLVQMDGQELKKLYAAREFSNQ